MYDTVLLPTDGASSTNAVVEHALDVAARRDASVHVLYVVDDRPFTLLPDDRVESVADGLRREGEDALADAASALAEEGVDVTTGMRTGTPTQEILAAVEDRGADLVVMGTRGDDPTQNLLGSTAQKVVTLSPVPVLTVGIEDAADATTAAGAAAPNTD
ncbi:universal stress protein [Halobacterium wangiae]|uniref:universal stress protein n=1 Tax=Halobacterium wangiae TaxID=2902623 RepID=UPI001E55439B|nr:universal stress protein [Halobacterium wangiae]